MKMEIYSIIGKEMNDLNIMQNIEKNLL